MVGIRLILSDNSVLYVSYIESFLDSIYTLRLTDNINKAQKWHRLITVEEKSKYLERNIKKTFINHKKTKATYKYKNVILSFYEGEKKLEQKIKITTKLISALQRQISKLETESLEKAIYLKERSSDLVSYYKTLEALNSDKNNLILIKRLEIIENVENEGRRLKLRKISKVSN